MVQHTTALFYAWQKGANNNHKNNTMENPQKARATSHSSIYSRPGEHSSKSAATK
jgi:hypothetical protein